MKETCHHATSDHSSNSPKKKKNYTKNTGQPALKEANSHHKFSIVPLFQKVPDSSQTSAGPSLYPDRER